MTNGFHARFDKERASYYWRRLSLGEPIEGAHTVDEGLILAGVLLSAAITRTLQGAATSPVAGLPPKRRLRVLKQIRTDLVATVDVLSDLASRVLCGEFDAEFEAQTELLVSSRNGIPIVRPVAGFSGEPSGPRVTGGDPFADAIRKCQELRERGRKNAGDNDRTNRASR